MDKNLQRWKDAGDFVASSLSFGEELDAVQQQRVYQYYLPIFFWAHAQLAGHKAAGMTGPLVVRTRPRCVLRF